MVFTSGLKRKQGNEVLSKQKKPSPEAQCRICLDQCSNCGSDSSLSLDAPLTGDEIDFSKPVIVEVLELLFKETVTRGPEYPDRICKLCVIHLDIAYLLFKQYQLSKTTILEQPKESGEEFTNDSSDVEVKNNFPNNTDYKAPVEILVSTKKYDGENFLSVKEESDDSGAYDGFLQHLGSTISATLVEKVYQKPKIIMETPVLEITKKVRQENQCDTEDFEPTSVDDDNENILSNSDSDLIVPISTGLKSDITGPLITKKSDKEKVVKPTKRIYRCKICDEVFRSSSTMSYHFKKHVGKLHGCKKCDKKFLTAAQATVHYLRLHNEKGAVEKCHICGKKFQSQDSLKRHIEIHVKIRDVKCRYCPKKFHTQCELKTHNMIHTGEKPFPCKICWRNFRTKDHRERHHFTHRNDRPYHCKYCKMGHTTLYNLKVHMTTHSGGYACLHCDKSFPDNEILQFHLVSKHKERYEKMQVEGDEVSEEDGEDETEEAEFP